MRKIKQNKERQHPPTILFAAVILLLICTATKHCFGVPLVSKPSQSRNMRSRERPWGKAIGSEAGGP